MSAAIDLVLVAAVARNGVIGADNDLVWKLPSDLKHFKAVTLGRPIVMGRKTFLSIGRPLPGRTNIVVSRDPAFRADGIETATSLAQAIEKGREVAASTGADAVMIVGGGEIYAQALPLADRLEITEVDLAPGGDVVFPPIDPALFEEVARVPGTRGPNDGADFVFVTHRRRGQRA